MSEQIEKKEGVQKTVRLLKKKADTRVKEPKIEEAEPLAIQPQSQEKPKEKIKVRLKTSKSLLQPSSASKESEQDKAQKVAEKRPQDAPVTKPVATPNPKGIPVMIGQRKPVIIKNTDNLPSLGKKTIQAKAVGVVGGRNVDEPKRTFGANAARSFSQQGSGLGAKKFFKSASGQAFQIPQSNQPKRKNFTPKKNEYIHEKDTEKQFDIAKKKAISLDAVPKKIEIMSFITPGELAKKMNLKAGDIISKLISMGSMVTINQQIDSDTASIIASEYGCETHVVNLYDETIIEPEVGNESDEIIRAPIVTVMGHVDHGKTKLLDAIRSENVAEGEAGGITQHIGAYKVHVKDKGDIVFIDTPGHAAFTMMRARGASVTDIVVLVVAANDGVMPQTLEAIDHAKAAKVPIIVAVNKCDLPEANPDRVKQQLSEYDLIPEEWGGKTQYCQISAKKKIGIHELLESILVQAEVLELKANPKVRAMGTVLESKIDSGKGVVATVLVKQGTLRKDDDFVAGIYQGHVRTITDDKGKRIHEAGPATPVEITGLSQIPNAGDPFQVTEDDRVAKQISQKRQELERLGQHKTYKRVTLDNVYQTIQEGNIKEFNVIVKGDVQGSVEALESSLMKLETPQIRMNVIRASAGAIVENDINLAIAADGGALVIGFNVRPTPPAAALAEKEKIEIRKYNVIYDVIEDMKKAMEGTLEPIKKEMDIGTLEVRETFKVSKVGIIAGCMVTKGKITRKCYVRVVRDNIQISTSPVKISSLKRFKDDVKDVLEGFECGVGLQDFQDIQVGDILEAVEVIEVAQKLEFNDSVRM